VRGHLVLTLAVLAALLLLPRGAEGGQFALAWGPQPMNGNGWTTRLDGTTASQCGFEDVGTVLLGATTLAPHAGCFELFNAPAGSSILGVDAWYDLAKASTAPGLCARSYTGGVSNTPLNQCAPVTDAHAGIPVDGTSGAKWIELGLYNTGSTPVTLTTARANNVRFGHGLVVLDDPTGPASVSVGAIDHVVTGDTEALAWSATDPESSIGHAAVTIDGAPASSMIADGCVSIFLCGATRSGTVTLTGLGALADGPHRLALQVSSAGGSAAATVTFRSDHGAPAAPVLTLAADPFSLGPWRGRLGAVTVTGTASDAVSTVARLLDAAGAVTWSAGLGAPAATTMAPDPARAGPFALEAWQCDDAGHCGAARRIEGLFDPATPPEAATIDEPGWLGAAAATEGTRLVWPPLAGAPPVSGVTAGFVGLGRAPDEAAAAAADAARSWAPPAGAPTAGQPGEATATVPAAIVHGAGRVCLAVVPVSGAGHPAPLSGVGTRCIRVDEEPPSLRLDAPLGWSGGPATVTAVVDDAASGVAGMEATVDGVPAVPTGNRLVVGAEGDHLVHVRATDRAGNDREATARVRVDGTAPSLAGGPRVSFAGRTVSVDVRDAASGVERVTLTVGDQRLDTTLVTLPPGLTVATAHLPGNGPLDGLPLTVEARDQARPPNVLVRGGLALPSRATPTLTVVRRGTLLRARVTDAAGRPLAGAAVGITASPRGQSVQTLRGGVTGVDGRLDLHVRPTRTTRYGLAVSADEQVRPSAPVDGGTASVRARISRFHLLAHAGRLSVRARYSGLGETARVRLEAAAPAGGPWVDACLVSRRAVRLDRRGRIRGGCAIPAAARGLRFRFRLVLASRDTTWPWIDCPGPSVVLRLPLG
jgi:hypothetical protein